MGLSIWQRWRLPLLLWVTLAAGHGSAHGAPELPDNGCQCLWQGSFAEVAPRADLVVHTEVLAVKGNAVDVRIDSVLKGDTWKTTARVWMKTKDYCRPDPTRFPISSQWIMVLDPITDPPSDGFNPSTPNYSFGRVGDYSLSACGGYFLRVRGLAATGNLVPDTPRWEHEPDMTPVLISLLTAYLQGRVPLPVLIQASEQRPDAKQLLFDTKSFLRGQDALLDQ